MTMLTVKWVKAVPHTHAMLSHVETETDQSCQGFCGLLSPEKHPCPSVSPVCKQFLLPKGRGSCSAPAVKLLQGALERTTRHKNLSACMLGLPPQRLGVFLS